MSQVVSLKPTIKGAAFVRLAIAAALAGDNFDRMELIARNRYGENSLPVRVAKAGGMDALIHTKAEVAAGATVNSNWAELLVDTEAATAEFFAFVRERSLLGRIGLRRVPLRTRLIGATSGFSAAWVGEGKAVPLSSAVFDEETLPTLKVATIAVATQELLQSADPSAETVIRDDLAGAVIEAINQSLMDPANTGVSGVEPASITNGAPTVNASGDGLADLRLLLDAFPGDLERAVLVGSPQTFAALHDPLYLPGLGVRGGNALGIPAFATTSAGDDLAIIDPAGVAYGEGTIDLRTSTEASIEMLDSNLTGDSIGVVPPTAASTVNLWTTNSVAWMASVSTNWKAVRPSVAVLSGIEQS